MSKITISKADEVATPESGKADIYVKTDGTLAVRNDNGTESVIMDAPHTSKVGFVDYNNAGGAQTHNGSEGFKKLTNDTLGSFTNTAYFPTGMTTLWNSTFNQFDFTELSLGDMVDIRIDILVTTSGANQNVELQLQLGIGGSPYTIELDFISPKSAGTYKMVSYTGIYMGDINTLGNPGEVQLNTDASMTNGITVNGWYSKITRR